MRTCSVLGALGMQDRVNERETQEKMLEGQMPRMFHLQGQGITDPSTFILQMKALNPQRKEVPSVIRPQGGNQISSSPRSLTRASRQAGTDQEMPRVAGQSLVVISVQRGVAESFEEGVSSKSEAGLRRFGSFQAKKLRIWKLHSGN